MDADKNSSQVVANGIWNIEKSDLEVKVGGRKLKCNVLQVILSYVQLPSIILEFSKVFFFHWIVITVISFIIWAM